VPGLNSMGKWSWLSMGGALSDGRAYPYMCLILIFPEKISDYSSTLSNA
jgi:hypothetical protein